MTTIIVKVREHATILKFIALVTLVLWVFSSGECDTGACFPN